MLRILEWFCPPQLYEAIEGDLMEQFERDHLRFGQRMASLLLLLNVISFFRPGIVLRNKIKMRMINASMTENYLKVALRNIQKRKLYALINAFGLSIGIAFCGLIYLYILDEASFDQWHSNKGLIYRVEERSFDTWQQDPAQPYRQSAWVQAALMEAMQSDLPEVQYATRFNADYHGIFRYQDKAFTEKITFVDSGFFRMFSFRVLNGNPEKFFRTTEEVILTPAVVDKYFGDADPVGKLVRIDCEGDRSYLVAGVVEAPPANSSLNFEILLPQQNRPHFASQVKQWGNFSTPTFVQLYPKATLQSLSLNMEKLTKKYMGDKLEKWKKESAIPVPEGVKMLEYRFTPLAEMHLKKEVSWHKVSDPQYSYILGAIAALILVIACINYISLALTTSAARRTEVGIRKTVGAVGRQLLWQFTIESVMLAVISMILGIGLLVLFLPYFNEFTGKGIKWPGITMPPFVLAMLGISIIVGLIAGIYPALVLSGFRPSVVLKGASTSRLKAGFTKPLVVLQFTASAILIISSVLMYRQMKYVSTKDLGYHKDQILVIPTQTGWNVNADKMVERFRSRTLNDPDVISVAGTTTSFNQGFSRYGYKIKGEQKSAYVYGVDPEYIPTLGIAIVQGRNFDRNRPSDSLGVIVNEALVRDMKWSDPLNEHLNWREDTVGLGSPVIGVVRDYHFNSLESGIEPMFLSMSKRDVGYLTTMLVKIGSGNVSESVNKLRSTWKDIADDRPFEYTFLDEDVARQYQSYERWMKITGLATGFAILISCLGLFGLSGINAVNRTKEIGIRKVMGASLSEIFVLLNRQFVWLSLIAFVFATPVSWIIIERWFMTNFKFQNPVGWEVFALSMGAGLFVALLAVSYHAVQAALLNPAETLKHE